LIWYIAALVLTNILLLFKLLGLTAYYQTISCSIYIYIYESILNQPPQTPITFHSKSLMQFFNPLSCYILNLPLPYFWSPYWAVKIKKLLVIFVFRSVLHRPSYTYSQKPSSYVALSRFTPKQDINKNCSSVYINISNVIKQSERQTILQRLLCDK
jgi:hypothetical protein